MGLALSVDDKWLSDVLKHVSDHVCEFEAAKTRIKLLMADIEDARAKVSVSDSIICELESKLKSMEMTHAARIAEARDQVDILNNELQMKTLELERARQSLRREENSVKILKCDAAYAEESHGNEWKTLSEAHSNLLSDNAEQQWKLEELTRDLRATEKEVQGFLYDCRIASLSDATEKVRSLTTGTAQGILLLDEAERRSKIISEALLGLPCHESLLLRVCSRIATTLSEPCLEQLPSVVEQLKVKLDEYEFLLGVPSRSVGPTRANAILSLKEIANIIEINDAIDDASFLSNLTAAVADFRSKHLLLKKRAKALKEQLNKKTALLEACNAEGEMMTALLQRANRSSGSEDREVSNQLLASPPCEQYGHSALSLECRMAAERLTYHNGERMRVLEIFRPFYTGDSVLDACECAKKELEKFCAIESYVRAQLSVMPSGPPAYGQGMRDCFSAPGAGNVTDSASTSELLEEQCAAVVEEMSCLRRIVNASNELIATAGYDVHNGDLPRSIAELLSRNNKDQERLNVLEDEILRTEELRKFVSACATAVGCPIKNVEVEQQTNKVLEAVRGVVSKYNAKQAEAEGIRTPLTASNTTHMEAAKTASTEDPYYDELLRVVEGVEALSIELRVNDSLPVTTRSASVELRAREACENLERTKDVIRSTMQGFQKDITMQKEQLVEQLNELEEVKGFLYNALDIDPSKAQPLSLKQLVGSMRAKLHGVVSENRSIETTLEQLRSENAALEESLRCAEQQLSETRTELRSLCQMDHPQRDGAGQTREGNDVATGLSRRVAKQAEGGAFFGGALSSRPEVKELSDLLVDTKVHSGRIDPATPQSVGVAENCYSRSGSPAFKINNLPIEPHLLLRDLEEVTKERDALLRESERIVDQVQHALCDYVDVQQELFPSSMNTDGMNLGDYEVGVGDIVQRCIERLHVFLSNSHGCREPTTPATRDYASSLEVLTPLNGDGWRHQDNLNAADAEGPRLRAEFESFSWQLQTLFNDALRMTAADLRLGLPPPTEKNNFAALHGLRSLIERLVSRCRDSVASFEDGANSDVNLARRRHSRELQSLLTVFDEHVASLVVDAGNSVLPDRVFEDSASKSGSIGGPPLHLTPQHIAEVGNCLHRIHTDVRHIVITCLRNAEMPLPSALHTATLSSLAKLLGDVVPTMLKQVSTLQEAVFSGCQALGSLPLNLSSGTHHLAEWAEHFSTEVQKVIYTKEGCEHLLDSIEVLLTNHGINMTDLYVPAAAQNILGDAVCHSSESCRASPRAYGYIEKVEEHTDLRTGALLSALHNLVEQLERKCRTLTLEWQALTDQNNRLLTAQQENEEELVRVQDLLQEMRQIVKRKVEEDLKLEQSLEGLEDHLAQQARELALKYCADRDIISQQFEELRDTIRRAVMPTQDNVLRGMLHH
uniref:Uncharacterized protein TCIL3000_11_11330 n=1 Tax=Trypanosoma congolense (strain IL3000) TaxID=1068625 RepID=G0V1X3_TRYCI|nr:unnamed protein product [Trypanosoma congolense IL3000]